MANPVVNSQKTTPNDPQQIKALLQRSSNPMSVVQSLASQGNPAAQAAMSYLQNGSTPQLQQLGLTIGNQNYETAQQIFGLQTNLMNQNNTNLINAIQGFNQINQNITAQGAGIMEAIQRLGYQMDQCCCSIKTQMLQDRLADAQADLVTANGQISNANQTQTLLNTMGKWVANPAAASA